MASTKFYYYPDLKPTCQACLGDAGNGGSRIIEANGTSAFVCQGCRDTIANIVFLARDHATATLLLTNGFCKGCFSRPAGGGWCAECSRKTPAELGLAINKGTTLVLLANVLQNLGTREQMLEAIVVGGNDNVVNRTNGQAAVAALLQLRAEPNRGNVGAQPGPNLGLGNNQQVVGQVPAGLARRRRFPPFDPQAERDLGDNRPMRPTTEDIYESSSILGRAAGPPRVPFLGAANNNSNNNNNNNINNNNSYYDPVYRPARLPGATGNNAGRYNYANIVQGNHRSSIVKQEPADDEQDAAAQLSPGPEAFPRRN